MNKLSIVVFSAVLVLILILASGGVRPFLHNLFSANALEVSETISLDETVTSQAASGSVGAKRQVSSTYTVRMCATSSDITASSIRINEVAWMGSGNDSKKEWVELKNVSDTRASLSGWQFMDASGKTKVYFPTGTTMNYASFKVMYRGRDFTGTINNSNEALYLFDEKCILRDVVFANPSWPAGSSKEWKTAERSFDGSWHTSLRVNGTPGAENSIADATAQNPATQGVTTQHTTTQGTPTQHTTSASNSSDALSSAVRLNGPPDVNLGVAGAASSDIHIQTATSAPMSASSSVSKIALSRAVRLNGARAGGTKDADDEYVELKNDSDADIVLSGYTIKKISSTGKESTLVSRERLEGKKVPSHGYLLLANETGYVGSVSPDVLWPHSYTLSAEHGGIALYVGTAKIDEVIWDKLPAGSSYVRVSVYPQSYRVVAGAQPKNSVSR